jgi:hypothetical protein
VVPCLLLPASRLCSVIPDLDLTALCPADGLAFPSLIDFLGDGHYLSVDKVARRGCNACRNSDSDVPYHYVADLYVDETILLLCARRRHCAAEQKHTRHDCYQEPLRPYNPSHLPSVSYSRRCTEGRYPCAWQT